MKNFLTVLLCLLFACAGWFLSQHQRAQDVAAIQSTVTAQMEAFGKSMQAKGSVVTTPALDKKIKDAMGPQLMRELRATNSEVQSLVQAVGQVQGQVSSLEAKWTVQPNGLRTTRLVQDRKPVPLGHVDLAYTLQDPGTMQAKWTSYPETFRVNVGQWRTGADGMRAALTLERQVKRDGQALGTEQIPIGQAEAFFTAEAIRREAPMPRWTVFLGASTDTHDGARRPAAFVMRHLDRNWSWTAGTVNRGAFLGGAYTF